MEKQHYDVRIFGLDQYNYPKFRAKIIDLYLNAFTTGEYAQHIPDAAAESTLDEMLRNGFGNMAFVDDRLAGALIAFPLEYDNEFPKEQCPDFPVETSLYIAEVMVNSDFQGRGIASRMLQTFLAEVKGNYTDIVIRVWDENKPAVKLYEKLGFTPLATISQTKLKTENETFEMNKVYMTL